MGMGQTGARFIGEERIALKREHSIGKGDERRIRRDEDEPETSNIE
jgi:hypothetical protein